jgi:hypothetical protein
MHDMMASLDAACRLVRSPRRDRAILQTTETHQYPTFTDPNRGSAVDECPHILNAAAISDLTCSVWGPAKIRTDHAYVILRDCNQGSTVTSLLIVESTTTFYAFQIF